jgi:hypothetical protein
MTRKTSPKQTPDQPEGSSIPPFESIDPKAFTSDPLVGAINAAEGGQPEAPSDKDTQSKNGTTDHPSTEQLDADEEEYRRMRRDLPNVAGAAATGLLALGVSKAPDKNDFFRTKKGFCPVVDMVSVVAGMEYKFFAVDEKMLNPLASIGIRTAPHVLYLTITTQGVLRVIPVRCVDETGDRNEYSSTKEKTLLDAQDTWMRLWSDVKQGNYRGHPALVRPSAFCRGCAEAGAGFPDPDILSSNRRKLC